MNIDEGTVGSALLCDGVQHTHDWLADKIDSAIDALLKPNDTPSQERNRPSMSRAPKNALDSDADSDEEDSGSGLDSNTTNYLCNNWPSLPMC